MKILSFAKRAPGALAVVATALALAAPISAWAQHRIDGITGTSFSLTTGTGEISTPDGGSIHFAQGEYAIRIEMPMCH